jgi:GTP diphosphokinase / guanosine-3',5'-bis(diphosphate) 3'-diphosphatase
MDGATVAAGILHDIIEDPKISEFQLHATFKDEISFLIEGVTKLRKFEVRTDMDADTAYHYRIFLSSASDIRVAIIKLADRLHNMRTLEFLPEKKRIRNCVETQQIFIPLARFLGMKTIKDEYEDIVLRFLDPNGEREALEAFGRATEIEDPFFEAMADLLHDRLVLAGIDARVVRWHYNLAHFKEESINTPAANGEKHSGFLTIATGDEKDIYPALGLVHSLFEPIKGGFEDLIMFPSADLKRSIDTRVHDHGIPFKVRIVSEEMYLVNKFGIIPYLANPSELKRIDFLQDRLREIHHIIRQLKTHGEPTSVEFITRDLFRSEIFVISEKQERISLPPDSTVLDFAYHADPEKAEHFSGAVVNTTPVAIQHRLRSCDKVVLETSHDVRPGVEWLSYVSTQYAKMCIKKSLQKQTLEAARSAGKKLLTNTVNRIGMVHTGKHDELENLIRPVTEFMELENLNEFYEAIGYGEIAIETVVEALRKQRKSAALLAPVHRTIIIPTHPALTREYPWEIINSEKLSRGGLYLCETCAPIPGDDIYVRSTGKRTTVHKAGCRAFSKRAIWAKRTPSAWGNVGGEMFPVRLLLKAFRKEETLDQIRKTIAENHARLAAVQSGPGTGDGLELLEIIVEVADRRMLAAIEASIINLKDVIFVSRN